MSPNSKQTTRWLPCGIRLISQSKITGCNVAALQGIYNNTGKIAGQIREGIRHTYAVGTIGDGGVNVSRFLRENMLQIS